jgi:hypothetical protein
MSILKWLLILLAVVVVGAIGAGQAGLFESSPPTDLGLRDGKLTHKSVIKATFEESFARLVVS